MTTVTAMQQTAQESRARVPDSERDPLVPYIGLYWATRLRDAVVEAQQRGYGKVTIAFQAGQPTHVNLSLDLK